MLPSPSLLPSFVTHTGVTVASMNLVPRQMVMSYGQNDRIFPGWKNIEGKFQLAHQERGECRKEREGRMDARDRRQLERCSCPVRLQTCNPLWSLAKRHLSNQVEGSPQSVTEGKLRTRSSPGLGVTFL